MKKSLFRKTLRAVGSDGGQVLTWMAAMAAGVTFITTEIGFKEDPAPKGAEAVVAEFEDFLDDVSEARTEYENIASQKTAAYDDLQTARVYAMRADQNIDEAPAVIRAEQKIEELSLSFESKADELQTISNVFARDLLARNQEVGEDNFRNLRDQFGNVSADNISYKLKFDADALSYYNRQIATSETPVNTRAEYAAAVSSLARSNPGDNERFLLIFPLIYMVAFVASIVSESANNYERKRYKNRVKLN